MGTLLIWIAVTVCIAVILVLVYVLKKRRFGPRQLSPGTTVRHEGIDYRVRGTVTYQRGPFGWWEHLLEGGPEPIWFGVEEDTGQLDLTMWMKRTDLASRPEAELVVDNVKFRQIERGRLRYSTAGTTGLPAEGVLDYVDYANADESAMLRFERWTPNMPWEISTGRRLLPDEITVLPAPSA